MKVNENNSELLDYSKALDKKLRNQITKKEEMIEDIKKGYDNKIESAKLDGNDRYTASIKKNDDALIGISKDFEEKLNLYKDNLEKTQKNIANEEEMLKNYHFEKMKNFEEQYLNNTHDQFQKADESKIAIQDQTQNSLKLTIDKSQASKKHLENSVRAEIDALSNDFNQKEKLAKSSYRDTMRNNLRNHQTEIALQRADLRKEIDKNTEDNKRIENEKVIAQTEELKYLDKHQKDVIAQKHNDFKIRYEHVVNEHNALLSELKTHLEADVKKLAEKNTTQKKIISKRADDPFYRVETLNPKITEAEKDYIVSLKIPEYEQENVHLSVNGRGVKMTLSRRFADTIEDQNGGTNRSTRSELFSKEFSSIDLLDPKQVVQKYEDGTLTFKIQKL